MRHRTQKITKITSSLLVIVLCFFSVCCFGENQVIQSETAEEPGVVDFQEGYRHHMDGKREIAFELYNSAITKNPDLAQAYLFRGIIKAETGELGDPMKDFDLAIKANEDFAQAYYIRGLAHSENKNINAALADFNKGSSLTPFDYRYYIEIGKINSSLNNFPIAIENFEKAIKADYAILSIWIKEYESLDKIIDIDIFKFERKQKNIEHSFLLLGEARLNGGFQEEAYFCFRRALGVEK